MFVDVGGFKLYRVQDGGFHRPIVQLTTKWYDISKLKKERGSGFLYIKPLQQNFGLSAVLHDEVNACFIYFFSDISHATFFHFFLKCTDKENTFKKTFVKSFTFYFIHLLIHDSTLWAEWYLLVSNPLLYRLLVISPLFKAQVNPTDDVQKREGPRVSCQTCAVSVYLQEFSEHKMTCIQ